MAKKLIKVIEYPDGKVEKIYKEVTEAEYDFSALFKEINTIQAPNTVVLIMTPEGDNKKYRLSNNGKWRHIIEDR